MGHEEEGEWEYASYKHGANSANEEAHIEGGLLYQPLGGKEGASEGSSLLGSVVPLCSAESDQACGEQEGLRLRRVFCTGLIIAVAGCGHPDEGRADERYSEAPIEQRGEGRGADQVEDDSGGDAGEDFVDSLWAEFT